MGQLGSTVAVSQAEAAGTQVWHVGEGGMMAAQKGKVLLVSIGGPRDDAPVKSISPLVKALAGGERTLSQGLVKAGLKGFEVPSDQLVYVDLRAAMRQLQAAAQQQGGAIGLGASLIADRVAGLKDALLRASPSAEGVDASFSVRFAEPMRSGNPEEK